ncbi:hypothetical protein [Streptomyces sp. NPDC050145]|uniref:hypothetical protein n=1 Tax=Streptomyces sp. NPDC050145 TaxID=3365602 RepID=UPI00378D63B6
MGSGGEQTLASSASDKKRAAKFLEEHLMPDTRSASAMADGGGSVHPPLLAPPAQGPLSPLMKQDTGLKGLSGWASDQGVSDALVVWEGQANKLLARLQVELNGLHGTKNLFNTTDTGIGTQSNGIRTPSSFDGM